MPLGPAQRVQEEGMQQGAHPVTLPDASLHVDRLPEPARGAMRSLAAAWRNCRKWMTAGGTERWRRMIWSAPCRAVLKALRAPKEKM